MKETATVACPYCGEMVRRDAVACPHCGSDERTGWSEFTYLDGIDLGDEVDYEGNLEEEFSVRGAKKVTLWRIVVGGALLLLFAAAIIRSLV